MDDGCIWARNADELSTKLNEWAQVLHEAGLLLNPDKRRVYFSPYMAGPREVKVQQTVVPVVDVFFRSWGFFLGLVQHRRSSWHPSSRGLETNSGVSNTCSERTHR